MDSVITVAAFRQGELHVSTGEDSSREAVLALELDRLLVKMVRVPAGESPVEVATPLLKAISPYPDDPLAVTCETVRESEDGSIVIAAALPESSADDLGEALDAAKLNVVKIDALAIGALRGIWSELHVEDGARRLVTLRSPDCISLIVLDGDEPVSIRAIADDTDLKRETWLSLLEAEDFNGPKPLAETIDREIELESAITGIRERAADETTIDALPDSWREVLTETRFKAKLVRNLAIAGSLWLLVMAVLFGVPIGYGFMTDRVKTAIREHSREYTAVKDKKAKTELVRKYSDHARGALEIMKAVSDRLPAGVTLGDWRFTREDGVSIRGEADDKEDVYVLKDRLVAMGTEVDQDGDRGEAVFKAVELGAVSFQSNKYKFEIDCRYEGDEE